MKVKPTKKAFREHLNSLPSKLNHKNGKFHQVSRPYGDYLYAQDRDKFNADYEQWVYGLDRRSVTARFESQIPGFVTA